MEIVKQQTYRSEGRGVNKSDDMIRATIDFTRNEFRRIITARIEAAIQQTRQFIYLACPYSHSDETVKHERFMASNKAAAKLINEGHLVIAPISHSHSIAQAGKLPSGWDYWERTDRATLQFCKALYVLCINGWKTSEGVKAEIKIANEMNIPIVYLKGKKWL